MSDVRPSKGPQSEILCHVMVHLLDMLSFRVDPSSVMGALKDFTDPASNVLRREESIWSQPLIHV